MSTIADSDLIAKMSVAVGVLVTGTLAMHLWNSFRYSQALSRFPMANDQWDAAAKVDFLKSGESILAKGLALAKGGPFRLNDISRPRLILPPKYIDEIKNDNRLDFRQFVAKEFHSTYPGFDGFNSKDNQTVFQDAVRTQLTQALTLTIEPMAKEAPNTLRMIYGDSSEWIEGVLHSNLLKSIARLTSLTFLGEEFMNNPEWQHISVMYTVDVFMAAKALNKWPAPLRPFVHWFLPECKKIRQEVKIAKALIEPEVDRRRKILAENGGKARKKVLDSVDWFTASAKGEDFDYTNAELSLSMASIHTTCNVLAFAMYDLVENPEYMSMLREEIKKVVQEEGGWEKSTLFKLKLMDSFLKESMRLHPHSLINMPRKALVDMSLKDGTFIPKGTYISIGPVLMRDSSVFPEPDKFDGHRFLNLRSQPGNENKYQFVTTSPEVNVFGHGHHACPGRFFASNELKLLLAHMVMLYDFKLPEGQTKVEPSRNGMGRSPNSRQKILWRARKPEFDIIGIN